MLATVFGVVALLRILLLLLDIPPLLCGLCYLDPPPDLRVVLEKLKATLELLLLVFLVVFGKFCNIIILNEDFEDESPTAYTYG